MTGHVDLRRTAGAVLLALLAAAGSGTGVSRAAGPAAQAPVAAPSRDSQFPPAAAERIGKLVRVGMSAERIPGVVVAVSDPARGSFTRGYGVSDRRSGSPMRPDRHYRIASVTKTFTAHAVLDLVARGKLSLREVLARYVPDIPYGDRITVRDLLGMRGGVYDYTLDPAFNAAYTADPTYPSWRVADALRIIRRAPAKATPPRTRTAYSNSEYLLLGLIIEKVAHEPAGQYIIRRVVRRLGLPETSYPSGTALPEPFTRGYTDPRGGGPGHRDVTANNPAVSGTAGAMVSTVPDMARYAGQLARGAGLPAKLAAARQSWSPLTSSGVRLQYGLGVLRLGNWIGHDGAILGYSDMVFSLPAKHATVVVAVNRGTNEDVTAQAIWGAIVKYLYPGSLPSWP